MQSTNEYPDFSSQGYQVDRVLGENRSGGRVTYKAIQIKDQKAVAIKQFQFAASTTSWAGYHAYQAELNILKSLNHPNIPLYLNSFETANGFCLIQEYKRAVPLSQSQHFEPQEIKQIAIEILNIIVYLQQHSPSIVHRDIKPENILVNRSRQIAAYLIDFGFARTSDDTTVSSVVKGTMGFMPPEQLFNRELTESSDLYSLGMTLICLLTKTKSTEIGNLLDEHSQIQFKKKLPRLNNQFVNWLEKMVSTSIKTRYPNAAIALKELQPIDIGRENGILGKALNFTNSKPTKVIFGSLVIFGIMGSLGTLIVAQQAPMTRYTDEIFSMVNNTLWRVGEEPGFYHPVPWRFSADGTVSASNLWGGVWRKSNVRARSIEVHIVYPGGGTESFSVMFSPDGQSFTAFKEGKEYRFAERIMP
ncbi:serine/threonine protein kinase [Microcoleus vaginatus]|uniref:serine/threonine protein kinase n=1 Tax=Microcoleus vaginatus TaxID=119532 RepID=UPI001F620E1B|nr:serine/threonine protein kinase [Microcoleus vaginatus HSN003]